MLSRKPVGLNDGLDVGGVVGSNVPVGAGEAEGGMVGQPNLFVSSVISSRRLQYVQGGGS